MNQESAQDAVSTGSPVRPSGSRHFVHRWITVALVCALVSTSGATVAAIMARHAWLCELFTHFRVQYSVMSGICLVGFLLLRRRRMAAVSTVVCLLNVFPILTLYVGHSTTAPDSGIRPLRIATINVFRGNRDPQPIA